MIRVTLRLYLNTNEITRRPLLFCPHRVAPRFPRLTVRTSPRNRSRAARAAPDTAADLDQFAANFMRGLQQASATAGGSIDDNE